MVVGKDGDDGDHLMKKQFACVSCGSCRPRADGSGCNFYHCKSLNWTGEFEDAYIGYTDTSTYHTKKRKAQIEEQCAVMADRVAPIPVLSLLG